MTFEEWKKTDEGKESAERIRSMTKAEKAELIASYLTGFAPTQAATEKHSVLVNEIMMHLDAIFRQ